MDGYSIGETNSLRYNFLRAIPTGKTPGAGQRVKVEQPGQTGADDLDALTGDPKWNIRFARTVTSGCVAKCR